MKELIVFLALWPGLCFGALPVCQLPSQAISLSRTLRVWTFPNTEMLESPALPQTQGYIDFLEWARKQPNLENPYQKILAEKDAYLKIGELTPDIAARLDPILTGKIGTLRSANCLEALMMGEANRIKPMPDAPYEIVFVELARKSQSVVNVEESRLYLKFGDEATVDDDEIQKRIQSDLLQGWSLQTQVHNHPFSLEEPYRWNGGYTAPTPGDIQTYKAWRKNYRLPEARITNGVFTLILTPSEFTRMN